MAMLFERFLERRDEHDLAIDPKVPVVGDTQRPTFPDLGLFHVHPLIEGPWMHSIEPNQFDFVHEWAAHAIGRWRQGKAGRFYPVVACLSGHSSFDEGVYPCQAFAHPWLAEFVPNPAFLFRGYTDENPNLTVLFGVAFDKHLLTFYKRRVAEVDLFPDVAFEEVVNGLDFEIVRATFRIRLGHDAFCLF